MASLLGALSTAPVFGGLELTLKSDSVLDPSAVLFASNAPYGRAINGVSYMSEAVMTVDGYQYATWYHRGSDEDVYLARRDLAGGDWQVMDTGVNMTRTTSDAHNVISLGIAGDGSLHLSWDHHNHTLNYMNSVIGAADGPVWNSSVFNAPRNALTVGGSAIGDVTYPRFVTDPTSGDLLMTYRTGVSGNGNIHLATYDVSTGQWNTPHQINNGTSVNVNPYLNGIDVDSAGRVHMSWTYRPTAGSANYDIMYAYSDDAGATWFNSKNGALGTLVSPDDPGLIIDDGNAGNGLLGQIGLDSTLMNQQTQVVDLDGRVHVVMWSADDANFGNTSGFKPAQSDYFHYYRDPATGDWARTTLPNVREVGSRPDIAYDAQGNLYVAYVTPGPGDTGGYYTDGDLVIAVASKASGYTDWADLYTDTRDFIGEPKLDQQRLLHDGVLSVYLQENNDAVNSLTGTPLHVLDLGVQTVLDWRGGATGVWQAGPGNDWDFSGDGTGDSVFTNGSVARFGNTPATHHVNILGTVAPADTRFVHTGPAGYTVTGGPIAGGGGLRVTGGGAVTLNNAANTYTGNTDIVSGTLTLAGNATIANSATINVHPGATLNAAALNATFALAPGPVLNTDASSVVAGGVVAGSGSLVAGSGFFTNGLTIQDGATLRVGGDGLTVSGATGMVLWSDPFDGPHVYLNGLVRATGGLQTGSVAWQSNNAFRADGEVNERNEGSALLPFTPEVNRTYELSVEVSNTTQQWVALGFRDTGITSPGASNANDRFTTGGVAWMLYRDNGANNAIELFGGLATANSIADINNQSAINFDQPNTLKIVLDTTGDGASFTADFLIDAGAGFVSVSNGPQMINLPIASIQYAGLSYDNATSTNIEVADFLLAGEPVLSVQGDAVLTVLGDLTLTGPGSILALDLATPEDSDRLVVGGTLFAGGTLALSLDPNAPALVPGDHFDVLDFAGVSGAFSALELPSLEDGLYWDTRELYTAGVLSVTDTAPLTGDTDSDGDVDDFDLINAIVNYTGSLGPGTGTGGKNIADGDTDGDRDVDDFDLINMIVGYTGSLSTPSVPEPGSAALMLSSMATWRRPRRH